MHLLCLTCDISIHFSVQCSEFSVPNPSFETASKWVQHQTGFSYASQQALDGTKSIKITKDGYGARQYLSLPGNK